jgi:diguanylate cyclase (GGDEF)-like protein/PAS domain S-box-containing protein
VHVLLRRQLERILGSAVSDSIGDDGAIGTSVDAAQLQALVELVSHTYRAYDDARSSTEPSAVEEALRASEERYALALRGANDGLWDWELPAQRAHVSARGFEMLGLPAADGDMRLAAFYRRIHAEDRALVQRLVQAHLDDASAFLQVECRVRHENGGYRWLLVRGAAVRDEAGHARRLAGSFSDVTPRKQAENELRLATLHDRLTGLPNRGYFLDALQRLLARSRRRPEVRFAVAFVDLDRLKAVNDTLGHQAGDALLCEFARRIAGCVRAGDVVARLSGDEFALLLDELSAPADALVVAERVNASLEKPVDVHGHQVVTSASIGVVLSERGYETAEQMLRDADIAMYRAKERGRRGYALFDREMHERATERLALEADLTRALPRGELRMHYQPIVRLGSLEPVGCEAFARWHHPTRGIILPAEFLPIAEEGGLSRQLGRWVVAAACKDARAFARELDTPFYVSINLSPSQLLEGDLPDHLARQLEEHGLTPDQVAVDVTESAVLDPAPAAAATLARLRALRLRVHVDDFGTGQSSLSHLHRMDVDCIKIDRSFVADGAAGEGDADAAFSSMVGLAQRLGKLSVAEGIETEAELAMCRRSGCDLGQGYLFARPMDVDATTAWLRAQARKLRGRRRAESARARLRD